MRGNTRVVLAGELLSLQPRDRYSRKPSMICMRQRGLKLSGQRYNQLLIVVAGGHDRAGAMVPLQDLVVARPVSRASSVPI